MDRHLAPLLTLTFALVSTQPLAPDMASGGSFVPHHGTSSTIRTASEITSDESRLMRREDKGRTPELGVGDSVQLSTKTGGAITQGGIQTTSNRKSEHAVGESAKSLELAMIEDLTTRNRQLEDENARLVALLAKAENCTKSSEDPSASEALQGHVPPVSNDLWDMRALQQKLAGKQQNVLAGATVQHHFDIVINAFKRDFELGYGLSHYTNCSKKLNISKIHVVWGDHARKIPSELAKYKNYGVEFYIPPDGNITNRFKPLNFLSDAIFHVDDDLYYSCAALEDMFELWRSDPENAMVGASTRKINLGDIDCSLCPIIIGDYNVIFATKGAFVHKRFFSEIWTDTWKPMREVADKYNCAEDIMFSWMHLIATGSVDHVYPIAGSVNVGGDPTSPDGVNKRNLESMHIVKDFHDHLDRELGRVDSYGGLNTRTWNVRGEASSKLGEQIHKAVTEDEFFHASDIKTSQGDFTERRALASRELGHEIHKAFPEHVKKGLFNTYSHRWWRSNKNWALTCRGQSVACYNRVWKSCSDGCDVPVRGQSSCFTGDSACWAGNMYDSSIDSTDASILVCSGPTDADCQF